jgi:hypothetical protein
LRCRKIWYRYSSSSLPMTGFMMLCYPFER